MKYIEEIRVPYPPERSGVVTSTGTSAGSPANASEFELFDHYNIWIPGKLFCDSGHGSCSTILDIDSVSGLPEGRYITRTNTVGVSHSNTILSYKIRRPRMWFDGVVTGRLHYSGIADAGETMPVRFQLTAIRGAIFSAGLSVDVDIPSPATDWEWTTHRFDEDASTSMQLHDSADVNIIDSIDVQITFQSFTGDEATTYAENVVVHGFELMFKPRVSVGQATDIPAWSNRV